MENEKYTKREQEIIDSGIKIMKKKNLLIAILFGVLVFAIVMIALASNLSNNRDVNEQVMYCEMANLYADAANEMMPYFEMYLDDSIETIRKVNETTADLLELSTIKARDLEYPHFDCPIEKCNGPFAGPVDEAICDMVKEIKYEVKR